MSLFTDVRNLAVSTGVAYASSYSPQAAAALSSLNKPSNPAPQVVTSQPTYAGTVQSATQGAQSAIPMWGWIAGGVAVAGLVLFLVLRK